MAMTSRNPDLENDDDDQDAPYDSIASRPPLVDPMPMPQAGSTPRDLVTEALKKKIGYPAMPASPGADVSSDPLMKQFNNDQAQLSALRDAKRGADAVGNVGQAFSQLAAGTRAPQSNEGLYRGIASQNDELVKGAAQDLSQRSKVTQAIEARKTRELLANQASADRATKLKDTQESKNDSQVNKWTNALKDDLDPNKARGGNLASNQKRVDNADRVTALLEQVHNNPDPRQMEELAISTQALLSTSGTPAAEQVKALIPRSAIGNVNKMKEWLLNDPTGTGQQEFVKRMADTVNREREVAVGQVQKAQKQRLSAYDKFKQVAPDDYNRIVQSYGLDEATQKGISAQKEAEMANTKVVNGVSYRKVAGGWEEI